MREGRERLRKGGQPCSRVALLCFSYLFFQEIRGFSMRSPKLASLAGSVSNDLESSFRCRLSSFM